MRLVIDRIVGWPTSKVRHDMKRISACKRKLINKLAQLAADARAELLVRKSGPPSESQVQAGKDDLKRVREENEEFRKQIASIEVRQGIVLIKE